MGWFNRCFLCGEINKKCLCNKTNTMKLREFINQYSHNNLIRLWYETKGGRHEIVLNTLNDVSMDHEVIRRKGKNRHYINNEVVGLTTCLFTGKGHKRGA